MSTDRMVALEERLARLERQRRVSAGLVIASLTMLVATQTAAPHAQPGPDTKIKAPFKVVNNVGETIFSVESTGAETRVSVLDKDFVVAGMNGSKDGAILHVSSKDGVARLGLNFDGPGTGPSILMKDADGEVFTVGSKEASLKAPLTVTTGDSGKEDALQLIGSMSVRDSKGRRGASITPSVVRVHGGDGIAVAASLGVDDAGKGRLAVGLPTGPRAVIGQPASGGVSFALYDGPTKDYRIGMLAVPGDVSYFRLTSAKQQATITVNPTTSAFNLFNQSGHAAATLSSGTSGTGQLELGDEDGDTVVEAGATNEGLGVVRAGPRMGGVVGFEGSLPWAILGKRSR
jgi:hypothetical protein